MIDRFLKRMAPVAAMAMGSMLVACDMGVSIGGSDGVPLAELDMTGATPTGLVLASSDTVVITDGAELSIDVEGPPNTVEALRFTLDDDTLGVMRENGFRSNSGPATVRVTMPTPSTLVLAGSGGIAAQSLARRADVTIAGSGRVDIASLEGEQLDVTIAGSGSLGAAGRVDRLDMTIAGSGDAEMDELQVGDAEVTVMGSGDGAFASDGSVDATIMGSGDITVYGRANCTVSAMGSGKLNCRNASPATEDEPT